MAGPLAIGGLFLAGAAHQLGPKAAAIAVDKGSQINTAATIGNRTPEAVLKAERLMSVMRSNAKAIELMRREGAGTN